MKMKIIIHNSDKNIAKSVRNVYDLKQDLMIKLSLLHTFALDAMLN
jgi:hypothetical protein